MVQNQQSPDQHDQISRILDGMDANSSISATTVFKVSNEERDNFERLAGTLVAATTRMSGVSVFDFLAHLSAQPHSSRLLQYLIYEKWENVSSYRKQWNSDHFKKFQSAVANTVADPPVLSFYRDRKRRASCRQDRSAAGMIMADKLNALEQERMETSAQGLQPRIRGSMTTMMAP